MPADFTMGLDISKLTSQTNSCYPVRGAVDYTIGESLHRANRHVAIERHRAPAFRETRTAKKLASGIWPRVGRAFNHRRTAPGARPGRMVLSQGRKMRGHGEPRVILESGQGSKDPSNVTFVQLHVLEAADVVGEPPPYHVHWHGGLEPAIPDKINDGMENTRVKVQKLRQALGVAVILSQGILKRKFPAVT